MNKILNNLITFILTFILYHRLKIYAFKFSSVYLVLFTQCEIEFMYINVYKY